MPHPTSPAASPIHAELVAVLAAVTQGTPRVLTTADGQLLPAGPFEVGHRSLQAGLRAWVEEQTHHPLGYMEQLYTFADGDRTDASGARVISVSYLGLTRESADRSAGQAVWQDWYRYFPWEDWCRRRLTASMARPPCCPARPCTTTIAASWPRAWRGCAPRSSTGPWCSS